MFKKIMKCMAVSGVLTASVSMVSPVHAKPVELRFAHGYPTAAQHHRNVLWFTEEVTKRTNGDVTFRIFPSAQLMPINQELPAILSGQISMTYSVAPVVASVDPLWGVFDLPFLFDVKTDEMDKAAEFFNAEGGGGLLGKRMEERGFKLITIAPTDWLSSFYLRNPDVINEVEQLKGLKIRNTGGVIANLAGEVYGYNPIAIAGAELIPAISQGVVDGGIMPPIYAYDNKLPLKGVNMAPFSWPAVTPIIMSLAQFNKLTPEQQEIMMQTGRDLQAHTQKIVEENVAEVMKKMEADGAVVSVLPDDKIQVWREKGQPVWEAFVKQHGVDGATILETASGLIDK